MIRLWLVEILTHWRGKHYYISTACLHGDHEYCVAPTVTREGEWERLGPSYCSDKDEPKRPAACKFCDASCQCQHHRLEKQ